MLKNYLKLAVRNILKSKFYSTINIIGLAVAITIAIFVSNYAYYELSKDMFSKYYNNIYRVEVGEWFHISSPVFPIIEKNMPQLEAVILIDLYSINLEYNSITKLSCIFN